MYQNKTVKTKNLEGGLKKPKAKIQLTGKAMMIIRLKI